jgi:glycosyltransferase involved in cell wall biosynthesis
VRSGIVYVSFDQVPAPKGAATHIQAFVQALAGRFGTVDLVTVGTGTTPLPPLERWPGVVHHELPAVGRSLIDRVLCFQLFLERWLNGRNFEAIHFRSVFEGMPLLRLRRQSQLIFEVNGLPSIELKYRYPKVVDDRELMRKLRAQEGACLDAADLIVTPSSVTRDYLAGSRGVPSSKMRVIPNGVDLTVFQASTHDRKDGTMRLLYFGTLAAWQGVELGIRALAQISGHVDATFTIVGTGGGRQRDTLLALAAKLGIANRVRVLPAVPQNELAEHLSTSDAVLAPLTLSDRNTVQGCCPLKALEGMASGKPVIATDLPVMRELGRDGEHFLLVRPGSVDHIAETIVKLWADCELARRISTQARRHIEEHYTWERAGEALIACYEKLPSTTAETGDEAPGVARKHSAA